jgi:hypothetical protein
MGNIGSYVDITSGPVEDIKQNAATAGFSPKMRFWGEGDFSTGIARLCPIANSRIRLACSTVQGDVENSELTKAPRHRWTVIDTPACVETPAISITTDASPSGRSGRVTLNWPTRCL